jgi:hypothetical protein
MADYLNIAVMADILFEKVKVDFLGHKNKHSADSINTSGQLPSPHNFNSNTRTSYRLYLVRLTPYWRRRVYYSTCSV